MVLFCCLAVIHLPTALVKRLIAGVVILGVYLILCDTERITDFTDSNKVQNNDVDFFHFD